MRGIASTSLLAAALILAAAGFATAQTPIKLKYASFLPKTHPIVEHHGLYLVEAAQKDLKGKVDFEVYPSEQAGKANQLFDLVKSGAVDIADLATGYYSSDKLPLLGVWEVPGLKGSTCALTRATQRLAAPGEILWESELKPAGIRVLSFAVNPPYGPTISRVPVDTIGSLKGLKMRNAGGMQELAVQALGGVPVKMTTSEIFEGMSRGTVDTAFFPYTAVVDLKLYSIAKYSATGYSFGRPGVITVMSERKFQALPADVRKTLTDLGNATMEHWCSYIDGAEKAAMQKTASEGVTIHTWTPSQVAEFDKITANVSTDWAKKLDQRGKPGTKLLQSFTSAVEKAN